MPQQEPATRRLFEALEEADTAIDRAIRAVSVLEVERKNLRYMLDQFTPHETSRHRRRDNAEVARLQTA